jgi:hypothetical protein
MLNRSFLLAAVSAVFAGTSLSHAAVVAEWNFDDLVGGTTLEDQVGTIDGTQSGVGVSVVASGAGVPGSSWFGNAYDFDGNSNGVHVNMGTTDVTGAISNFGTGAFTVAGWFDADERNSGTSSNNYRWVLGNLGATGGFVIHLGRPGTASARGKLHVSVGAGADQVEFQSANRYDLTSDAQQWHWFAATSDGSTLSVYVDGSLLGSVGYLAGTTATPDAGSTGLLGRAFDGRIDQISVWDEQLTGTLSGSDLTGGALFDLWQQSIGASLSGDLDDDGFVGITDLNIVLGNWNQNVAAGDPLAGDPSGDGFVGIEDLNEVLGNWNAGTPPAAIAVPEPATMGLVLIGGLALIKRRGR